LAFWKLCKTCCGKLALRFWMGCKAQARCHSGAMARICNAAARQNPLHASGAGGFAELPFIAYDTAQ